MSIYIAHQRNTSNALPMLILRKKNCFQRPFKRFFCTAGVTKPVWKCVPDDGSGDRKSPTAECAAVVSWHVQMATLSRSQSLTTGKLRYIDAAVDQVAWRLAVKTPVDRRRELELDTICHIEPVQVDV